MQPKCSRKERRHVRVRDRVTSQRSVQPSDFFFLTFIVGAKARNYGKGRYISDSCLLFDLSQC